jgi:teichuronic acid biosynthesis glycosyltransferase TuaG
MHLKKYNPKISIVMACYNCEKFIKDAIESVLKQDYENYELIIVDDCSNDSSMLIIDKYLKISNKIKCISLKIRSGIALTRNHGISITTGDWVAILDADDIYHPKKLSKQVEFIKSYKLNNLVLVGTNCITINDKNNIIKKYYYPELSKLLINNLLQLKKFPPHSSILYNKNTLLKVCNFNCRYIKSQDYDLWLRLSVYGNFGIVGGEPLTYYRIHKFNISNSRENFEQKVFVSAALLCYQLRRLNNFDPSIIFNDNDWINLLDWISQIIEKSNYVIINNIKLKLKNIYYLNRFNKISNVISVIRISNIFFNINIIYIIINTILFKSKHSSFLLHHWRMR